MGSIDPKNEFLITHLIERYSYDGAQSLLKDLKIDNVDLYYLVSSCKYASNFDFETSLEMLEKMSPKVKNSKKIKKIKNNLLDLIEGNPEIILEEFIENIKIKVKKDEYIDFLGRAYRFKEAILKYVFIRSEMSKKEVSLLSSKVSKRNILKTLKKDFKIYTNNLSYGLTIYINKRMGRKKSIRNVLAILNSDKMESLMRLRHESPVGHGFKGVSKQDIEQVYDSPKEVINDFVKVCGYLDIDIKHNKYDNINESIKDLLYKYTFKI
ncbi:MAG: hypothetical protein N4A54_12570 [Peptostreptococcaceae bacterium]|jgi:hypothetical protein|nr:hypothetical protein [Peptostreptococcaceae bacterium]